MEREEVRGSVARAKEAGAGRRAEDKSQICPESPLCGPETCRRGLPVALGRAGSRAGSRPSTPTTGALMIAGELS